MKSVRIRSFSGLYFPAFALSMEGYSVSNPYTPSPYSSFHVVLLLHYD